MSNEIKGLGNSYTALFWEYDSRIGRRWNLDPKPTVGISQYSAFSNSPILFSDHLGDSAIKPNPLMPRHPINGPGDYGYVPYNIIGSIVNGGQSLLNKGGEYLNAASQPDPVAGVSGQLGNDLRGVGAFISGGVDYFKNTPNKQILSEAKTFFTNPDNYFQAAENAFVLVATGKTSPFSKINVSENFTLKVGRPAAGAIQYGNKGDLFLSYASKAVEEPGTLNVAVHGTTTMVEIGNNLVSHRLLANLIRRNPQFTGQPIKLLSCNTGALPFGFAKNLANKLGVPVSAPNDIIWAFPNGKLTIGPTPMANSGSFVPFLPGIK